MFHYSGEKLHFQNDPEKWNFKKISNKMETGKTEHYSEKFRNRVPKNSGLQRKNRPDIDSEFHSIFHKGNGIKIPQLEFGWKWVKFSVL